MCRKRTRVQKMYTSNREKIKVLLNISILLTLIINYINKSIKEEQRKVKIYENKKVYTNYSEFFNSKYLYNV